MATSDSEQTGVAGATLPGHSIDVLRSEGNAAEARAEFERLIEEGVESGIDPRTPAAILDAVRAEIRGRAPTSANSGAEG
jgi:hypothetical protein